MGGGWPAAAVSAGAALAGSASGAGIRILLGRIPRGMTVRAGLLECSAAVVTALGAAATWGSVRLVPTLLAGLLMVALTGVDVRLHRLPDAVTLPAVPVAAAALLVLKLADPASGSLVRAILCSTVWGLVFLAVHRISSRSMGRGDVKLVPTLGLLTGYVSVPATVVAMALAFLLSAVVAIVGLLLRRMTLSSALPFGPFLLLGTWLAVLLPWSDRLLTG